MILPLKLLLLASFQLRVFVSVAGHFTSDLLQQRGREKKRKKKQAAPISTTSGGFVARRQLHLNASDLQTQSNAFENKRCLLLNKGSVS